MPMLSHQEARRRAPGQPLAASRLQTPSLTTATSRSSSMTSGASATTDSAFATTVVAEERLSPPLIELDDGDQQAPPLTRRLAYEAGAGITPTDKLRALLRQMESEARAAKPSQLPSTLAPAPSSSAYREPTPSVPAPIPYPSSGEDDDGQYSPPSPPPRISNPYLYSRRATERREVDEVVAPRSPEQPRRLPSRAIALRAAAAAVEAEAAETASRRDTAPPTPLETFIASNHEPSTSRRRMESVPRPPTPKGKERAEDRYDSYDEDEYVASPPRRRAALPARQSSDDEDMPNYEEERSPPRRRMPIRRSIQAPDTSAAFAAGLNGLEEADEFDLEGDSMIPWNEDDTLDSAVDGRGELANSQDHASNRSHSREYSYPNTPKNASFTTASAGRTLRQSPGPGDTSLPPVPGPESSDDEEENTALHARAAMFRPSPRASPEPWSSSQRTSVSSRDRTTFTDARSVVRDSPSENTRFEQTGESTRYQSARFESSLEEQNDRFGSSTKSLRSQGSSRSLRDSHGEDAPLRTSASSGASHRASPPARRSPKAELRQSLTVSPRAPITTTPPKRVAPAAPDTPPPAAEDSDTLPQSTPESARSRRLRESRENRGDVRASTPPRQSPPARASASVRWSDDTEQTRADMSLPSRLSSEASMRTVELTPPEARRHLPEVTPPRAVPYLPATTSPVSTPPPRGPLPATPAMKTPRPPGAWGTPPVRGPVTPAPAPAPVPSAGLPRTPVVDIPDLVGLPTPRPPGAWRTPAPAAKPSTPVAPPTVGTVGGPTPRPPGAWYTPTVTRGSTVPFRFSALRNEVRPDDTMSSTSSLHESIGDVSIHRLRSPKRTSPSKTSPGNNNFLSAPIFGSPKRSPSWSLLSRPAYPPPSMPLPVTPTKSQQSHLHDDDGDGVDPDMSWTTRLKRAVMSPVRRPPPSTAFSNAQSALEAASRASAQARSRVEAAQRAWASALASVPADPEPRAQPVKVVEVARRGYSWGVFMLWAVLELFLLWCVFRITLDYATSSRLLAAIDPFHPQLGSYALGIPMPTALEAFATRRAAPANLFDILDSLGLGLGGATAQRWAPPS